MDKNGYSFAQLAQITGAKRIELEGIIDGSIIESLFPSGVDFSLHPHIDDAMNSDMDTESYVRVSLKNPTSPRVGDMLMSAKNLGNKVRVTGTYTPSKKGNHHLGVMDAERMDITPYS